MSAIVINTDIRIPEWVKDFDSFRRWSVSNDFPERGHIVYLGNTIWVDLDMERTEHNQAKTKVSYALVALLLALRLGRYFSDGMRVVHPEVQLSQEPDGVFVSKESLQRQRVQLAEGEEALELVGSPDMVLEVISPSSVEKDTATLPQLYWKAGIQEYWLIDPRHGGCDFTIYKRGAKGYVATRSKDGWLPSKVFGKSFRLVRQPGDDGLTDFTLEVQ